MEMVRPASAGRIRSMDKLRIEVDADRVTQRTFTALEQQNLPFSVVQAANATAFEVRQAWERQAGKVFDQPTSLTRKAALYTKATKAKPVATVYLRDEAFKGNPPAKYLLTEVEGGARRSKGFESLLQRQGAMPAGMFAVTGRDAQKDAFGNLPAKTINQILSQLGASRDSYQNETEASRARRRKRFAKKGVRGNEYFALKTKRGKLQPGVFERVRFGPITVVRTILRFVSRTNYKPRYDIFGFARKTWQQVFPFHFDRELKKAVESSKYRKR